MPLRMNLFYAGSRRPEGSEITTAVPKLLDLIDCKGAIVTVGALNCQTDIVKKVIEKEADYIFAIKCN